jgi:hypothetical protein
VVSATLKKSLKISNALLAIGSAQEKTYLEATAFLCTASDLHRDGVSRVPHAGRAPSEDQGWAGAICSSGEAYGT